MKNIKRTLVIVLMAISIFSSLCITYAKAASNVPYVFCYDDSFSGKTIYRFYQYNSKTNAYSPKRELYSKGSNVYAATDLLLTSSSAGKGLLYNVFDSAGNFYFITKCSKTFKYNLSGKKELLLSSGSLRFNTNSDDIGISVVTTAGTRRLSNLAVTSPTNPSDEPTPDPTRPITPEKSKNRIEMYTNSSSEFVYKAYNNNKVKLTIVVSKDETKVLNQTSGVRLTDTLKGTKFAGIDKSYNVYLYESNGILYRFKFGNWHSAEKMQLQGNFKTFKKDTNGFITTFITTKGSYSIGSLTSPNKWRAKKTYAVTKSNYVTLYVKGTTTSKTLKLDKGKLYLNNKKIASGVKYFGFVSAKKLAYIKSGKAYTATISNPTYAKLFCKNARNFRRDSVGLINKILLNKNKIKKVK